jgi:hypothetical protein
MMTNKHSVLVCRIALFCAVACGSLTIADSAFAADNNAADDKGADTVNGIAATHYSFDQRAFGSVGSATSVEVQLTPTVKVAASILAADSPRDVAVLWIDPATVASVRPVPLACAPAAAPPVADGQRISTIDTPFRQQKGTTSGTVSRVTEHEIESDLILATGSAGGPVFTAEGVVGITSIADESAGRRQRNSRVVRLADVCDVVAAVRAKLADAAPPSGTRLPVEPERPFPIAALKEAVQHRGGSLSPYQMSSTDFDIAFITPVQTFGTEYQAEQMSQRQRSKGASPTAVQPAILRPLMAFGNWSQYFADFPPLLLIRVTPKMVESFWTKVARGAAQTQGIAIPAIKRITSGFLRMRALCGETEITPIHPFKLEQRISDSTAVYEGLYVFDPGALGPSGGSVKLVLYSEKEPGKADTQVVDAKVVQQIWDDFASYRAPK